MSPAWRNSATRSPVSAASSLSGNRHPLDAQGRCIRAVAEHEIVRRGERAVHVFEIAGNGDLADAVSELSVLDPESGGATRIVARHAVHAHADQLSDVEALAHILHQLFGR